jgi:signal peptidase I
MKLSNNFKRFLRGVFAILIFLCVSVPKDDFAVVVKGGSMEPVLKNNQLVLAAKEINPLFIDDIVVIKMNNETIVKRIKAMQGDKYIENLNDEPSYMLASKKASVQLKINKKLKISLKEIPENYYFVEGDNRSGSFDSRNFGLIHKSQIIGKCLL